MTIRWSLVLNLSVTGRTGLLTVKLRGRTEAPDQRRGRTLSYGARGDTTDCHGPLQRLLGDNISLPELGPD